MRVIQMTPSQCARWGVNVGDVVRINWIDPDRRARPQSVVDATVEGRDHTACDKVFVSDNEGRTAKAGCLIVKLGCYSTISDHAFAGLRKPASPPIKSPFLPPEEYAALCALHD